MSMRFLPIYHEKQPFVLWAVLCPRIIPISIWYVKHNYFDSPTTCEISFSSSLRMYLIISNLLIILTTLPLDVMGILRIALACHNMILFYFMIERYKLFIGFLWGRLNNQVSRPFYEHIQDIYFGNYVCYLKSPCLCFGECNG